MGGAAAPGKPPQLLHERARKPLAAASETTTPCPPCNIGAWHVLPGARGGGSSIRHTLSVTPAVSPPQSVGELSKSIFEAQVIGLLEDLQAELGRQQQQQQQCHPQ